jgi:glycosyltransferase involved in cell wall biosynthesis
MKLVGFAEGARGGIIGIVSVPTILSSTAGRGHSAVLVLGGPVTPGREELIVPDCEGALIRKEGEGTFGVVSVKAWTRWAFCPAMLWRFSRLVRGSDFVTLHSLYSFPVLAGYLLAQLHRKPYGIWPHGVLAPFQRQVGARKKWVYNKLFANRILRNASVLFYSAAGEREEAAPLGFNTPSVIIPDGFNAEEFSILPSRGRFRERFLNGHTGPLVLFLARLNAKKGLDLLIKAMQRVVAERPEARLAIVGPPDPASFNKQVLQWVKENGIEPQTVVSGAANPGTRLEAFADADVYVLPSHAENFGFSVFEAMACGIPVVVSETLNYAAEFARSGAGLALPRTPEDFSTAIINLIDQPHIRRQMGICGQIFARQYSLEATGAKVVKAVESVLQRRPFPAELAPAGCYQPPS